jgi:hypothetical protein
MMVPEPQGKNNIFNQVSEGMLSPVGKSIWGFVALGLWFATLGNGRLPMIERNHEVEANNGTCGYLAKSLPYHRATKNCRYDLHILPIALAGRRTSGAYKSRKPDDCD